MCVKLCSEASHYRIHPRSSSPAAQFPLAGRVAGVWQEGGREGSQAHTHPIREAAGLTGLCGSGTGPAGELASAATEVPQCRGSGGALGAGGVGASPAEARI